MSGLDGTAVALLPIWNEGNAVWSECLAAIDDPELETYHASWPFTACYAQHVSSLLQSGGHGDWRLPVPAPGEVR
jgi:hypothetical protein